MNQAPMTKPLMSQLGHETSTLLTGSSMKWLLAFLILIFLGLQYRLWVGEGSFAQLAFLRTQMSQQETENSNLEQRNKVLQTEVLELKQGLKTIEERARSELGMIKEGETFYLIIE